MIYFSRSAARFYISEEGNMPSYPLDVFQITQERYDEIQSALSNPNNYLSNDDMGFPIVLNKPEEIVSPRDMAKANRAKLVSEIVVTTSSGKMFDGDEDSQNRMARAIVALPENGGTIQWTLADNSIVEVTSGELREALILAGARQTQLWRIE